MESIHINSGGNHYRLTIGAKAFYFEDHPCLGPMLTDRSGEPLNTQPNADALFWDHYDAWRSQGKQAKSFGGFNWCEYKTRMQRIRESRR